MKKLFTIFMILFGIYFISINYATCCNAQDASLTGTITDREGKSQDVYDILFQFNRNNWINVPTQYLNYFYLQLRSSPDESEALFYSLNEIKEIDFKEKFNTGLIIRKRDGSYIDIKMNLKVLPHKISISFYDASGRLINSKKLFDFNFAPSENLETGWIIYICTGSISGNNNENRKCSIRITHDVRKFVFH